MGSEHVRVVVRLFGRLRRVDQGREPQEQPVAWLLSVAKPQSHTRVLEREERDQQQTRTVPDRHVCHGDVDRVKRMVAHSAESGLVAVED